MSWRSGRWWRGTPTRCAGVTRTRGRRPGRRTAAGTSAEGRVTSGRAETLDLWRTAIAKYDWVGQVVTSGLVEVEGDRARGWWYLIEFNRRAQGDGTMHLGHYDDEYVRTPEGWQFASRTMHMLYRGAMDPGVVIPLPPRGAQLL